MNYFILMFKRWNDFSSRSCRAEYWWATLISVLINLVCMAPNFLIGFIPAFIEAFDQASHMPDTGSASLSGFLDLMKTLAALFSFFYMIFSIVVCIPALSVGVRRLHDTNRSGWWILVPIVNLVFLLQKSDPGPNRFGAPSPNTKNDFAYGRPLASIPMPATTQSAPATGIDTRFDALEKLAELHEKGILSDSEFAEQKRAVLAQV
ncbi:MAG: DUF805 domain-containing protein [Acetobacter aceti]